MKKFKTISTSLFCKIIFIFSFFSFSNSVIEIRSAHAQAETVRVYTEIIFGVASNIAGSQNPNVGGSNFLEIISSLGCDSRPCTPEDLCRAMNLQPNFANYICNKLEELNVRAVNEDDFLIIQLTSELPKPQSCRVDQTEPPPPDLLPPSTFIIEPNPEPSEEGHQCFLDLNKQVSIVRENKARLLEIMYRIPIPILMYLIN